MTKRPKQLNLFTKNKKYTHSPPNHICGESHNCSCVNGLNDNCPIHGAPWPPRCGICGRFVVWGSAVKCEMLKLEAVTTKTM